MPPCKRARAAMSDAPAALVTLTSDDLPPVRAAMVQFFRDGKLCDTELCTSSGSTHHAHSLVLASASSFFCAFFTSDVGSDKSRVDIGEVSQGLIEPLLNFLYSGSCQIDQELLTETMELGDRLGTPPLRDAAAAAIEKLLSAESCVGAWLLAGKIAHAGLSAAARTEALKSFEALGESLNALPPTLLEPLLQDDKLVVSSELTVFNAVTRYLDAQPQATEAAERLLACVRYRLIPTADMQATVRPSRFMKVHVDVLVGALLEPKPTHRVCDVPVGVQLDLPFSFLDGWTMHYDVPYSDATTNDILDGVPSTAMHVFIGAAGPDGRILLGAVGDRGKVLAKTTSQTVANEHSGTFWYRVDGTWPDRGAFGFSRVAKIELIPADVLGSGHGLDHPRNEDGRYRLSWHLHGVGGWRAGHLNKTEGVRKLIYYR